MATKPKYFEEATTTNILMINKKTVEVAITELNKLFFFAPIEYEGFALKTNSKPVFVTC